MPTYALLGATGATGSAILRCLLASPPPDLDLNILVRSKQKLLKSFPTLTTTISPRIHIIQGNSTDTIALQQCLEDASVAFMCVADNASNKGVSLTADTVTAIVTTLGMLRKLHGSAYNAPTILQLRSASLNPKLSCQVPRLVYNIVSFCLHYSHLDIVKACEHYEAAAAKGLLSYIYVDPPTIHDAFGPNRTGHKLISCKPDVCDKQETALSYADLGAGFVEIASRKEDFLNQPVGVTATGKAKETWGVLAGFLFDGAKGRARAWWEEERPMSKPQNLFLYCGM
ncbi:averufin oxidase-like protein [Dothistroma septosporum NZE10]|uniref:Averufin oxidase A n=1 Tax=Dothistroma septosporum (strain NZE10 / CBS 128990) TaxID=675120 RepID=AVFA_DOTSN|nr:RecName: Full=Averufin oxidase A; AltName: Full=Dothistromin biosynthesis protein avfA; Flags: Precursor [Dothistroma septosporum NZE10]EME38862.1 averufin oxidase-like protein [Dothistroma septosporum NZE10]